MGQQELANAIFGGKRAETSTEPTGKTTTSFGTATTDSADGVVTVVPDGDITSQDGTNAIEYQTHVAVKADDRVAITSVDGSPTVTGVVGGGDRMQGEITKIDQHFWSDDDGAHVSSTGDHDTSGFNSLWTSARLAFRSATTELMTIASDLIELGKNSTSAKIKMCGGAGEIAVNSAQQVRLAGTNGAYLQASSDTSQDVGIGVTYSQTTGLHSILLNADSITYGEGTQVMSDYVVAKGTSGIWTYLKFKSGYAVCWGRQSFTTGNFVAWGSLYESSNYAQVNYPFTFAAVPYEIAAIHLVGASCFTENPDYQYITTTHTGKYYAMRPNTFSSVSGYAEFHVFGEWK